MNREKTTKHTLLKYMQEKMNSIKEMNMFHYLRKSISKNAGGTSRYRIKAGINKGKLL